MELHKEFAFISARCYHKVPGVFIFDSSLPGPTLGITINTHGNEPAGLAIFWFLRNRFVLWQKLLKGRVIFVLNNPLATENFFRARGSKQKKKARFVELNMNRLPPDVMTNSKDKRYEARRARELESIWQLFDVGLDIHSTAQDTLPMIINVGRFQRSLIRGFPIRTVISNIDKVQIGKPASAFYGHLPNTPVLGIEAGQHEKPESFERAIECSLALMRTVGLLPRLVGSQRPSKHLEYRIASSMVFPDRTFRLKRVFRSFETVKRGKILASSAGGQELFAPFDGHLLFCPSGLVPNSLEEEAVFFSLPKREI